jgi:hypothetical protein
MNIIKKDSRRIVALTNEDSRRQRIYIFCCKQHSCSPSLLSLSQNRNEARGGIQARNHEQLFGGECTLFYNA